MEVYGVFETDPESSTLKGLFLYRDSALREMHMLAKDHNDDADKMYGSKSDLPMKDMMEYKTLVWDNEKEEYRSLKCFNCIYVSELEVK